MLQLGDCINKRCPFSGKPVVADSLCEFDGKVFGFCNPGCRDKFMAAPDDFPEAIKHFHAATNGQEPEKRMS